LFTNPAAYKAVENITQISSENWAAVSHSSGVALMADLLIVQSAGWCGQWVC
jgi:hypothetical protein